MFIKPNEKELKLIYSYNSKPANSLDHANNLGYHLGISSWSNDSFKTHLEKLVKDGVLTKVFHTCENEYTEALYNFADGNQISFDGYNHMTTKLYYCY